jgi:hypothetical protein
MATTDKTPAAKTAPKADKKPAPTPVQRVSELLKRSALQGKITGDELDVIASLAGSLKVFLKA